MQRHIVTGIVTGVVIAIVLFGLLRLFGGGPNISAQFLPPPTSTRTHEQEIRAPFETVRAELEKMGDE